MPEPTRMLMIRFLRNMGVSDPNLYSYSADMLTCIAEVVMLEHALIGEDSEQDLGFTF